MGTPVVWEGNIGNPPEHKSFPNGNNEPRQLLRLNVMFDNSIPDGAGGYKDRGGFWANVEWWHPDAERFAQLFCKGMRVVVTGRAIMDTWKDKETGEDVWALKVEASRVGILPHRVSQVTMTQSSNTGQRQNTQQNSRPERQQNPAQQPVQHTDDLSQYGNGFDDDIPV